VFQIRQRCCIPPCRDLVDASTNQRRLLHALPAETRLTVLVPDEVTIKAGESVTWIGNKGLPHNVVFDEENVPEGTDLDSINHADQLDEEGQKVTSKFEKPGTYGYVRA